ncbi:MAG: hypothetical protein AB4041_04495 [Microcystaceae cyanobacterium]
MEIHRLEYFDEKYRWQLEPVEFSDNLNLLVGVSGAGKTRILGAIRHLKAIANGASLNGVKWNVCFSTVDNIKYHWSGCFETKESTILIDSDSEQYVINNISPVYWKIVTRKGSKVTVKNAEDFHISPSRQKAFIDLINVFEDEQEGWDD